MTAVMRAATRPQGSRVLRAAVVRAGKLVEERIVPRGDHLTIGPTERSTFVVTAPQLTGTTRLLEWSGAGYRLNSAPGVTGRVATDAGVVDVTPGSGQIALGESARGKVVVGDTVVLFHFVDPPVRPPHAQLPIAVRQGVLDDLDWGTTFIAAFSFLIHFGALGTVYSDWADGVVDDDVRVAQMVQIIRELPPPPPVEARKEDTATDASAKVADAAPVKAAPASAGRSTGPSRGAGTPSAPGRLGEAAARDIARALESSDAAIVLAIGATNGSATGRVLENGQLPMGMLNNLAASAGGVGQGNVAGLNLGGGAGGVVRPGAVSRGGLPGGDGHADANAGDVGRQAEVKKPVGGQARASLESTSGGTILDAPRVVGGMQGGLRRCYKRALDEDPTARGSLRVVATVGSNGEVRSAQPSGGGGLPSSMMSCVQRVVQSAQFTLAEGSSGATVVIPMGFIPQ
jgi:hypothetical protein